MPTASSAQSKKSRSKIIPEISIRCRVLFTFRNINSITKLVPKSKIPAITKSITDQLTSLVNCIAINGISNSSNTMESRMRKVFGFGNILIFLEMSVLASLINKIYFLSLGFVYFQCVFQLVKCFHHF